MHPSFKQALYRELDAQQQELLRIQRLTLTSLLDEGHTAGLFAVNTTLSGTATIMDPLPGVDMAMYEIQNKVFLVDKTGMLITDANGKVLLGTVKDKKGYLSLSGCSNVALPAYVYPCKASPVMDGCSDSLKVKDVNWPNLSYDQPVLYDASKVPGCYLNRLSVAGVKAFLLAAGGNDLVGIKGPPGTGKSVLLGSLCTFFALELNYRVLVTTKSHEALDEVVKNINEFSATIGKQVTTQRWISERLLDTYQHKPIYKGAAVGKIKELEPCIGVTAAVIDSAFYAKPGFEFDIVVVDEAGQQPMFQLQGLGRLAPRFVLSGDNDQLPPILSAEHTSDLDPALSGLAWLVKHRGQEWVTPLDISHRMNDEICNIVRMVFYGELNLQAGANKTAGVVGFRRSAFKLNGGRAGCVHTNSKEADDIEQLVKDLIGRQAFWDGNTRPLMPSDIAVLTPFRKQAMLLKSRLIPLGVEKIGTVDIMQGQSTAVVIFGLTSSDPLAMGAMSEFLFAPNRWNVAVSRAKCAAIVVGRLDVLDKVRPATLTGLRNLNRVKQLLGLFADWKVS